ncbi:hypothetical protein ACFFGT_21715 [Mucilaginibacter angelicae]|uniref:Uncharacterized protein n=1 Tax=Mucilaginibacter angelicae TaxID=869718 RepID=A0ABV6LBR8_9SPHI
MDIHDLPYRLKSARRKKRLVKDAFDKKLIELDKQRWKLRCQIRELPPIPLEKPYQSGYIRYFILRSDIARSDKAEFYQNLLNKINVKWWHHDKSFKKKKRRKGKYLYSEKEQKLREFDPEEFHSAKLNLSDAEKRCFYLKEIWDARRQCWKPTYAFTEQWRFVLVIRPHIIYTAKQIDEVLEQQLSAINKFIDWNNHWPRIRKLKDQTNNRWDWDFYEFPKYINEFKNKPKYTSKEAYLDH